RGRYAVALQEILRERLRALQARGGARWAEARAARGSEAIDDSRDQRPLGADDGKPYVFARRERQQPLDVVGGDIDVAYLGLERGAGVSGGGENGMDTRRLRAFPRQRVLAAAAADDQNLHSGPRA